MKPFGAAAILAGGKSLRMGFDKQNIVIDPVNNIKLIDKQLGILNQEFEEIFIVSQDTELYKDYDCIAINDVIPGKGPLSGIHSAMKYAKSEYIYFIACDMPYICLDYIHFMKESVMNSKCGVCAAQDGQYIEPLNSFFSKKLYDKIEFFINSDRKSITEFIRQTNHLLIEKEIADRFCPEKDIFMNLNTKEQLDDYISRRNKYKSFREDI